MKDFALKVRNHEIDLDGLYVKSDEEVIEIPSDDKTVEADDFNEIINKNQDSDVIINSNNDI